VRAKQVRKERLMELGEKKQRSEEPSTKLSVLHSMMFCDQGFNFEKDKCLIM
jgi:hypothetical protein